MRLSAAMACVASLALLLCGCGVKFDDRVPILASGLADAIRAGDEAAFVRHHVQPNDTSPSGDYWLATKAGGVRPDAAWDREVRDAFGALQRDLAAMSVDPSKLELAGVETGEVYAVDNDKDRQNVDDLRIRMNAGNDEYVFHFSEGMLSQRGWVLVGDPVVVVTKAEAR